MDLSYVLPLRCGEQDGPHTDLATYLRWLASLGIEVLVADGSRPSVRERHGETFGSPVRVLALDPDLRGANGKVRGVITGVRHAERERVVLADDDVRYDLGALGAMVDLLGSADLVVPQNVFLPPWRWHTRWDSARSLLNRAFGGDHPGTMGVRRSTLLRIGGYDGDVLFENLELLRTIRAAGGRVVRAPWLYVGREAPTTRTFLEQRVRQAYDDLAQPLKLAGMLSIGPLALAGVARRSWGLLLAGAGSAIALAEVGRRRGGGREVFPAACPWFAPTWVAERAVCVWIAVTLRIVRGGVGYRGSRIRRAATPSRVLRARYAARAAGAQAAGGIGSLSARDHGMTSASPSGVPGGDDADPGSRNRPAA